MNSQLGASARPTLLIVDDEVDVLDSLQHLLHRDYRILRAQSGAEALEVLQEEKVHVILSDQRMPGITGDELLQRAREISPDTVRLLFTGYADIQALARAVNQGELFRYVHKPWDSAELESVVAQAARQHELITERRRLVEDLTSANSKLEAANRELAESNALKTAFLEVASHELNTPLTVVQGLSDLLRLSNPERDDQERAVVDQISAATRQLGKLVANMLKLTHVGDYRSALRLENVELAPTLDKIADLLQPIADARRITLTRHLAPVMGEFLLDADKLRDVVVNLLSNAIKFTPDGGAIALRAHLAEPDVAEIVVADRGIGIDSHLLEHMFDPFFTELDPSRHTSGDFGFRKRGLGLGLSLVRRFVERHGGQVRAQSLPGEGTEVVVRWPRSPECLSGQADTMPQAG